MLRRAIRWPAATLRAAARAERRAGPRSGPKSTRGDGLCGRAVPLALLLAAGCSQPADAPREVPAFDGAAALAHVERQVAFGPRVPNTPAHAAALSYLTEHLRARADSVALHRFEHVVVQGDTLRLTNVFASFAPRAPGRVLLAAHWDTRPVAEEDPDPERRRLPIPGANDGASGAAVLLEVADALARALPSGLGVDILLLDGEDYGHNPFSLAPRGADMFLGSRAFARDHPEYRARYGILLDLVGGHGARFPREAFSLEAAPEVVDRVWTAARDLGHAASFPDGPVRSVGDDHVFLTEGGVPTIVVVDPDYEAWHTSADAPDRVSAATLEIVGRVLLEVLFRRAG